ncbi:MAG: T9SS type A sorting domain-containing protein [Bacteroidetes bacterium]|nr:T9SS type A sorting domain-containing protein [Bacteroidota bacterium]
MISIKRIVLFCFSLLSVSVANSQTVVSEWNFPNNPDNNLADAGIAANNGIASLTTVGGTSAVVYNAGGATTQAAEATGWDSGLGTKYWQISFSTTGYSNMTITSKQRSAGAGPRDFSVEYKIGAGAWTSFGTTTAGDAIWNTFTAILPSACDNQANVLVRWIMTSNTQADGSGSVNGSRISRIDDIVIRTTPANDQCSGAILVTCGSTTTGSTTYATTTNDPTAACSGITPGAAGIWYRYVGTGSSVTFNTCGSNFDTQLMVYTGTCPTPATCVTSNNNSTGCSPASEVTFTAANGTTYYIFISGASGANGNVTLNVVCPQANDACSGAVAVTCGSTTNGSTTTATTTGDPTSLCGTTPGAPGVWYAYTPTAGENGATVTASLCGSSYDTKINVYTGTCGSLVCNTGNDDYCGLSSQVSFVVTTGTTYYILVNGYSSTSTGNFTLALTCNVPAPPNCATYTSPANASTITCASATLNWTAPTTGGTPSGYLMYFGTNNAPNNIVNGTNLGNVLTYSTGALSPNTTYYWQVVPTNGQGNATGCAIYSFTTGSGVIANDACAGAIVLTSGVTINDDNSCATSEASPAVPTCWSSGNLNTLWYSVNVTGSTLGVLTTAGTLNNTQIAVYSGSCASLTQVGCNDDAPGAGCSAGTTNNSQLNLTGLSAGTYYIRVDGRNANIGTYSIMASTSSVVGTSVPVPGQDCTSPIPLCSNPMTIGNPGYQNTGNICDFTGASNCTSGEKNSLWLDVYVTGAGTLNFDIVANDTIGVCGSETDYDFIMWKTTGTSATNCATISSSGGASFVACNFSYLGVTGVAPSGNAPALYGTCYDAAYEPTINVAAGEHYYLVIQNYSSSTSGFTVEFNGTAVTGGFLSTSSPSTVLWTGGAGTTAWTSAQNWGGCSAPDCTNNIDAVVAASVGTQPVISANQNVENLTINSGATLTINAGITLNVCGNFTNNGNLVCGVGSTVNFNGTGTQTVSGNLTGTNKFANFTVTKTAGTVSLLNNIEVGGNLTTSNSTSIINTNGVDITLGGHFLNSNGTTTFTGINSSTSTFTFNGTTAQNYDPTVTGGTNVTLNNVVLNNTRSGYGDVTLLDNMLIGSSSSTGTLTLTDGDILTNAFMVQVNNTTASCVTTGNTTSFVNGNLRRYLTSSGSYDWPVGVTVKGYQRANTNFSTNTIGYIDAKFTVWPGAYPVQGGSECSMTYNQPAEDVGYWTLTANSGTGTYDMTLYPLGAGNTTGMAGWTIIKDPLISSNTWSLNGTCAASTATVVRRNGMSGFSVFGVAQSLTPLPIELLSFTGKNLGKRNLLEWATATEINNDYFTLERSSDGSNFENIAIVDGAGNSLSTINYNKYDETPFYGITYYRLKQTDYNGEYSFSQIIALENGLNDVELSNVHPNPTSNDINFDLYSPIAGTIKVQVMDYTGRVVIEETMVISNGTTRLNAKMRELAKGIYSLKVTFNQTGYSSVNMIIKQ